MAVPHHPGSRVVAHPPSLLRTLRRMQAELQRKTAPLSHEPLMAVAASPSRWEPATSSTLTNVQRLQVYRAGSRVLADVACGTGSGSVLQVQLAVPALGVTGDAVTTASGGTERIVRVAVDMPPAWESGAAHTVYLRARRVSGGDSTTVTMVRAWQR